MSTLSQLVDRILATLQGFARDGEEVTYLTTETAVDDLTFTVNEPLLLSQGLAEIGEELLWIQRVDANSSTVTIAPFGRGYQGSTAAVHEVNSLVKNKPLFPRHNVVQAVNDAIGGVYPDLYVKASTEFPYVAARTTYELPATAEQVHSIRWEDIGPSRAWLPIQRYRFDPNADTTVFPSGRSLDLYQAPVPGRTIQVVYSKAASQFTASSQEFTTATGLPASCEPVIVYGACFRLVGFMESPRLQPNAIESQVRTTGLQPGSSRYAAQHFMQLYQLALMGERERLNRSDPTSAHFRYI